MFIDTIKNDVRGSKKRIVLNELNDERILQAAQTVLEEDLAELVLIGNSNDFIKNYPILEKAVFINPSESNLVDEYTNRLFELRKDKGLTKEEAYDLIINNYMYFSCMLVLDNKADGIVSGINHSSKTTIIPALQLMKNNTLASSFFLMETDKKDLGEEGIFIFADCALNQYPNSIELSSICKQSINSFKSLIKKTPKVAFLSHSTNSSSKHENIDKVKEAVAISRRENPNEIIDGELQLDAAIIPEVANIKYPNSILNGRANILIFPDIDSGNIGYKLVERFSNSKAYGPIIQGLKYPVNDLSRGSSVEDIIGVIVITALQAMKNML